MFYFLQYSFFPQNYLHFCSSVFIDDKVYLVYCIDLGKNATSTEEKLSMAESNNAMPAQPAENGDGTYGKLTEREVGILSLVAEGKPSKEVATALYISKRTVDFHLGNIYRKFQVRNRMQALNLATGIGIINPMGLQLAA